MRKYQSLLEALGNVTLDTELSDTPCESCPYFSFPYVPPENNGCSKGNCDLMIVGEAPGRDEALMGRPFVGRSGKIVRTILGNLNIQSYYITNVVKCRPTNNETPVARALKIGREILAQEVLYYRPRLVVALGNTALKALTNRSGISSLLNSFIPFRKDESIKVLPTYHPAAALRKRNLLQYIVQSFAIAEKYLSGELQNSQAQFDYVLLKSDDDLTLDILNDLEKNFSQPDNLVAFDVETSTLHPTKHGSKIWMISLSNGKNTYVFITEPLFGKVDYLLRLVKFVLTSPSQKIAHNAIFDIQYIKGIWGYWVNNLVGDTRIEHYLKDENLPHALSNIINEMGLYNHKQEFKKSSDIDKDIWQDEASIVSNIDTVAKYNAGDSFILHQIHSKLMHSLSPKQKNLLRVLLIPATYALARIHLRGIKVDKSRIESIGKEYESQLNAIKEEVYSLPESKEFLVRHPKAKLNLNSTPQLREIYFDIKQMPVINKTAKNQPSLDRKTLKIYCEEYKDRLSCLLLKYRELMKLQTAFITGLQKAIHPITNRIYPTYNLIGTVTGRLSCKEPNLQQIPKSSTIRTLFSVEDPKEWWFIEADYSQMELRVACALSRDEVMREAFVQGKDMHTYTASLIFGKPESEVDHDTERKVAKFINFGIIYGISAKGLQDRLAEIGMQITEQQAAEFINKFLSSYPKLSQWIKETEALLQKRGYVETPLGRRRHLYGVSSREQRQAINFPVQSSASDVTLSSLVRLTNEFEKRKLKAYIVGTVHDSILFEVHESVLLEVVPLIKEIMETPFVMPEFKFLEFVPIKVDISIGKRWGEWEIEL